MAVGKMGNGFKIGYRFVAVCKQLLVSLIASFSFIIFYFNDSGQYHKNKYKNIYYAYKNYVL